jgi:DNA recombination protein RmuC
VRRPGLTAELSATYDVTVTGPTTLAALLSSLKMGFQTLRIQKNASDILQRLGEAKTAFQAYGSALDAVDKKLDEAKNKVREVGVRHRAALKPLRDIDAVPAPGETGLLALPGLVMSEDEAA